MRKFGIVLKYELKEYLANKGFMAVTIILTVVGILIMFLPRVFDMSDFTGVQVVEKDTSGDTDTVDDGEKDLYLYYDEKGIVDEALLTQMMPGADWQKTESREELVSLVGREGLSESGAGESSALESDGRTPQAGYVITSETSYEYYVYNKSMSDNNTYMFDEVMRQLYRNEYSKERGWDIDEIQAMYQVPITVEEKVLNKNNSENFWYCYILIIAIYIIIVLYGQMIAVSVTNEKSNRAMEVLVTSTHPNSLLFGKVIAGAVGGLLQSGLILGGFLISYKANRDVWGGQLDMFFNVPGDVLIAFALFGIGGYLFYAFLYGAMGALVSKTEDVSKSSSGLMVIILVVYFFALSQLSDIEGPIVKVLSFLPISSYSTMFARIAMGSVALWEVVVSFVILVVSILAVGALGAKIYRMGTLRYGNTVKRKTVLKELRKQK